MGILYIQVRPRVFFAVLVRSQIFAVLARSMTVPKVDHGRTISKHCSHIHIWHGHIHIWYGLGRHDLTYSNINPMCSTFSIVLYSRVRVSFTRLKRRALTRPCSSTTTTPWSRGSISTRICLLTRSPAMRPFGCFLPTTLRPFRL